VGGCGQFITCCLCCSFLSFFPCSNVGSLPRETALHELLQCWFFPRAAVLQELLQRGSPTGSQVLQQTCSGVGSFSHGATGPARSLLQCGLPTGSWPPLGIHLLQRGVFPGLWVGICSPVELHGLEGTACLTMVGCRGTSAPVPGASPALLH